MKLQIDKALATYTLQTGQAKSKADLAAELWPASARKTAHVRLMKYVHGHAKKVDIWLIHRICEICRCDPNLLLGWSTPAYYAPQEIEQL